MGRRMKFKPFSAAILCLASVSASQAATVTSDLVYGSAERNVLDLYVPDGVSDAPLLVWIHGGAWLFGDKTNPLPLRALGSTEPATFANDIAPILDEGIAVATINYQLSPTNIWPAQLDDVVAAFGFLRATGTTYGYDSSKIASMGFSAGGHLAAWAGLALAGDPATRLSAAISWSGPTDLFFMDADDDADAAPLDAIAHSAPDSPESLLIGATVADNQTLADAASPAHFAGTLPIGSPLPDFLMVHGDQDALVSSLQSQRLFDAVSSVGSGSDVQALFLAGEGHGGPQFATSGLPASIDFLNSSFATSSSVTPVSIPPTMAFMLLGFGALTLFRRRREIQ